MMLMTTTATTTTMMMMMGMMNVIRTMITGKGHDPCCAKLYAKEHSR